MLKRRVVTRADRMRALGWIQEKTEEDWEKDFADELRVILDEKKND